MRYNGTDKFCTQNDEYCLNKCYWEGNNKICFYDNKYYFCATTSGYLCSSDQNGGNIKIIDKLQTVVNVGINTRSRLNGDTHVNVNATGVYLYGKDKVRWYDLDGSLKKEVELEKMYETYIYGTYFFYIGLTDAKVGVYCYDMETNLKQTLLEKEFPNLLENEFTDPYLKFLTSPIQLSNIVGNNEKVYFKFEISVSEINELVCYDLLNKKTRYFFNDLDYDRLLQNSSSWIWGGKGAGSCNIRFRNDWDNYEIFDIKHNVLWLCENNKIVPYPIDYTPGCRPLSIYKEWKLSLDAFNREKVFFNGNVMFIAKENNTITEYDSDGYVLHKNWGENSDISAEYRSFAYINDYILIPMSWEGDYLYPVGDTTIKNRKKSWFNDISY